MHPAGLEDIDPQTVQLQTSSAEVQMQVLGEGGRMFVELALEFIEQAVAARQVVERGIGRVAPIALFPAPSLSGLVLLSDLAASLLQIGDEDLTRCEIRAVGLGDKEGFKRARHPSPLCCRRDPVQPVGNFLVLRQAQHQEILRHCEA